MRKLPDGVFHCFACGSEVLPAKVTAESGGATGVSEAYLSGWMDGLFGSTEKSFVHNSELARWEEAADRLDYYRGHRAGREAFLDRMCHPDRRPFAIAIFVTAAVAIAYQALGPSVGW
jgi:hypothetical protein